MYILLFKGELTPGANQDEVIDALAGILKKPSAVIRQRLFTGQPVPIRRLASEEKAKAYVAAFQKAGAILHIEEEAPTPVSDSPIKPTPTSARKKGRFILVGLVILAALVIVGGWWTAPIWLDQSPSKIRKNTTAALANRELVALAHLDARRAVALEERILGGTDPNALPDTSESFWNNLAEAGFNLRRDLDDALVALYAGEDDAYFAIVLLGQFNPREIQAQLAQRFQMESSDNADNIHYFSWFNQQSCQPSPQRAIHIQPDRLVIASPEYIKPLLRRLDSDAAAEQSLEDWETHAKGRLASLAVLQPTRLGDTLSGLPGMMLRGAGQAAAPARAVILGLQPSLVPPGAALQATLLSDQPDFLQQAYGGAQTALNNAQTSATEKWPDLKELFERISLTQTDDHIQAEIRFDTDIDEEISTLITSVTSQAFGMGSMGGNNPNEEQVDDNATVFGPASPTDLKPFASFREGDNEAVWSQGPFGIHIGELALNENGQIAIQLNAEGRGLPNLSSQSELVSLRLTDVVDAQGASLLEPGCKPDKPLEATALGQVTTGFAFVEGESVYFPLITGTKTVNLAPGVEADQVANIQGILDYQLPTQVKRFVVEAPFNGKTIEQAGLRLRFGQSEEGTLSYQVSGDTRRLLAVRGLNAAGQVLSESSSSWGDNWFGKGKQVTISVYGKPRQAEVVVATELSPQTYRFNLAGAYPKMAASPSAATTDLQTVSSEAFNAAVGNAPPSVSYSFNEPEIEVSAGPGLLAIERLEASGFRGLYSQMQLYVPDQLPIAHQLAGAVVTFEKAELPNGSEIPLNQSSVVSLSPDGGYWMNGTYVPDPERPWLKGDASLQIREYDAEQPNAITGQISYQAPLSLRTVDLDVSPGSAWENERFSVTVDEWQPNQISLSVKGNADRLAAIQAFDATGQRVDTDVQLNRWFGEPVLSVQLSAQPQNLRLILAEEVVQRTFPFRADLAAGN